MDWFIAKRQNFGRSDWGRNLQIVVDWLLVTERPRSAGCKSVLSRASNAPGGTLIRLTTVRLQTHSSLVRLFSDCRSQPLSVSGRHLAPLRTGTSSCRTIFSSARCDFTDDHRSSHQKDFLNALPISYIRAAARKIGKNGQTAGNSNYTSREWKQTLRATCSDLVRRLQCVRCCASSWHQFVLLCATEDSELLGSLCYISRHGGAHKSTARSILLFIWFALISCFF